MSTSLFFISCNCDDPDVDNDPSSWELARNGKWMHGVNFPWDHYGSDFGYNDWGYRGLANQGPSGWRVETRGINDAAQSIDWKNKDNRDCMKVNVALEGNGSSSLIFFRYDEYAEKSDGDTFNFTGQTATVDIYFPSGIEGPSETPTGVLVFFQDSEWRWGQSTWMNIDLDNVSQWKSISVTPSTLDNVNTDPLFDASQIRVAGIKVAVSDDINAANFSYNGSYYIDSFSITNISEMQFDFSNSDTRTEKEIKDIKEFEVKFLRWWLFSDCRSGIVFDENGYVTGLDDKFLDDFDEMIRIAQDSNVYLVPVLFDFLMAGNTVEVDGVITYGRADLINNASKRQSLLDNAIEPVLEKSRKQIPRLKNSYYRFIQ